VNEAKYIGMDVHLATSAVAVRDSRRGAGEPGDSRMKSAWLAPTQNNYDSRNQELQRFLCAFAG
jgi:hypothetical protein